MTVFKLFRYFNNVTTQKEHSLKDQVYLHEHYWLGDREKCIQELPSTFIPQIHQFTAIEFTAKTMQNISIYVKSLQAHYIYIKTYSLYSQNLYSEFYFCPIFV